MASRIHMNSLMSYRGRLIVLLMLAVISVPVITDVWTDEGVLYHSLGTDIKLPCKNADSSSWVEWRVNGTNFTQITESIDGNLLLRNTSHSLEGNYSCHDMTGQLLWSIYLRLGYPPERPSVECHTSNFEDLICTWKSSRQTFLPTKYFAEYRFSGRVNKCVEDHVNENTCRINRTQSWSSYMVNVTEVNPLGSTFKLKKFIPRNIVKPDPPENLLVEQVPFYPRSLRVHWECPSSWPKAPHLHLKFCINYRSVAHSSWSALESTDTAVLITDAIAGKPHVVKVRAKDFLDSGSWSNWSAEAYGVPWTEPTITPTEETSAESTVTQMTEFSLSSTLSSSGCGEQIDKVAVLVSLGIFAFVILVAVGVIAGLVWLRIRRKEKGETKKKKKKSLTSLISMKAQPMVELY